ncbi:MAG: GIY-YIG nuclease family protein [Thaumarchaeota archaeon]|nr:GIY-YIG nuclease family protein [Nitrososphaerota archaeon]
MNRLEWKKINEEIRLCKQTQNPVDCLFKLFVETKDGWVAYNLAEIYENQGNLVKALDFYKEACNLLPLHKYKSMAEQKIAKISGLLQKSQKKEGDILFVVSCTKEKIWGENTSADAYVPAKDAYTGEDFKKWLKREEADKYPWLILSAKYGFIEPDHPIGNYDVTFNDEKSGPISDETLRRQVLYQERLGRPLRSFSKIYVIGSSTYFEKVKNAFKETGAEVLRYNFTTEDCKTFDPAVSDLVKMLNEFKQSPLIDVRNISRSEIPESSGLYAFYRKNSERPIYVGVTNNLRRRIWDNHLSGNRETSALREKLIKELGSEDDATTFLQNCQLRIKAFADMNMAVLKRLEHLAIAYLSPELND